MVGGRDCRAFYMLGQRNGSDIEVAVFPRYCTIEQLCFGRRFPRPHRTRLAADDKRNDALLPTFIHQRQFGCFSACGQIGAVEEVESSASGGEIPFQRGTVFLQFSDTFQIEGNVLKTGVRFAGFSRHGNRVDLIRGVAHFRLESAGFKVPVSGREQQPYIEGLDVVLAEILQLDGNRTGEFPLQKSFVQWKLQRLNPLVKTGEISVILPGE